MFFTFMGYWTSNFRQIFLKIKIDRKILYKKIGVMHSHITTLDFLQFICHKDTPLETTLPHKQKLPAPQQIQGVSIIVPTIYREEQLTNSVCFPPSHPGNSSKPDCARRPAGRIHYLLNAVATSTATATVAPTIGLLPMPRKPIISTCAGTDEEPAN